VLLLLYATGASYIIFEFGQIGWVFGIKGLHIFMELRERFTKMWKLGVTVEQLILKKF